MVIPHFRKGQVNGEIAVLGITKSVKKKPPASGIYQDGSYDADDCDFKMMEGGFWHKADMPLMPVNVRFRGVKRTSRGHAQMSASDPKRTFALHDYCFAPSQS
jgi:hypothetical protein